MDYFSLSLEGICLLGQSITHMIFVSVFTGKKQRIRDFGIYFFLLCAIEAAAVRYAWTGMSVVIVELLVLYGINRFALGNQRTVSWVASVLAIYIWQLSCGIVNSMEAVIFPNFIGKPLLYVMVVLATLAGCLISIGCYGAVLKFLSLSEDRQMPYIGLMLFPGLFFFAAELYIIHTSYSFLPYDFSLRAAGKHSILLFLQILGLGALLCTLYVYRGLCRSFQAQAALRSLEQAAQAQKTYIDEAKMRYEQTKAFRHDIKNHLSVLNGLLNNGKAEEGKAYLKKLEAVSDSLSFACQTGNPVVDILLGEKLGQARARGIMAEVSVVLPKAWVMDDFDLCVIFANALDNAVNACQEGGGTKSIHVFGEQQGDFYMLGFENTCSDDPLPAAGTGLSNIRTVAEKYHGAMIAEKTGQVFSLHVLLNISLHPESISIQKP